MHTLSLHDALPICDQPQRGAFSTAAGPKQRDAFAVRYIEVEMIENLVLAKAFVDGS